MSFVLDFCVIFYHREWEQAKLDEGTGGRGGVTAVRTHAHAPAIHLVFFPVWVILGWGGGGCLHTWRFFQFLGKGRVLSCRGVLAVPLPPYLRRSSE